MDFQRGECVDVNRWTRSLDGFTDLDIRIAGELRVDPTLQADFGGASLKRFDTPSNDLRKV